MQTILASLFAAAALSISAIEEPETDTPDIILVTTDVDASVETIEGRNGMLYRAGRVRTNEVLPEGYPRPTAPEAIEIKTYPSVRRAVVTSDSGGEASAEMGQASRSGFWQLFSHISTNNIAMTAPVEMDYPGMMSLPALEEAQAADSDEGAEADEAEWAMAFLYRTADLGPTGTFGSVEVYDSEPMTVLALGVLGDIGRESLEKHIERLADWVAESDEWELAGPPRTFGYNGPMVAGADRWWEVQLPIQAVVAGTDGDADAGEANEATDAE
ncbi:MAG: heme-binding protein [Planctomycetota bacterium]